MIIIIFKGKTYESTEDARAAANLSCCGDVEDMIEAMEAGYSRTCWRIVHECDASAALIYQARRDTGLEAVEELEEKRKYAQRELEKSTLIMNATIARVANLKQEWVELQADVKELLGC